MKKKVLFLIESFIVGGAEKILIDIVNKLNPDIYEVTVCSVFKYSVFSDYQKYFEKPFLSHVRYMYCVNNHHTIMYKIASYLICHIPSLFYKIMIGDKYDTVVAFYEGMPTSLVASAQIKGKKIAWLHTSTDYSQAGKNGCDLKKIKSDYSCFDKIIAVSHVVKESFLSLFSIDRFKCEVIYNSIDLYKIYDLSREIHKDVLKKNKDKLFVSLGRLIPVKGFDRIINVAKRLKDEGYCFSWWIIGDGIEREKLKEKILRNKLEQEVLLLGHKDNPYPYLFAADCYVSTSYVEGLPISLLEAMALKKMIIASNIPVHEEILTYEQWTGGLLFHDDESMFLCLKKILQDKIDIRKYQEVAYRIVVSKFLSNIQMKNIATVL